MAGQILGIDWGTTNRRAYLVSDDGRCLRTHEDDRGMLAESGRFAASFDELLTRMEIASDVPVVMSGMVGSTQGWQEVAYLDNAVPLSALPSHLSPLRDGLSGRSCYIVPGYCRRGEDVDVMRGEETQLFGALSLGQPDGWVALPGTHSKWAYLRDGRIERWSTYMTGEMFAMLARGGTLSALMAIDTETDDVDAFNDGVALARRRLPLTHALFSVRARVVSGVMPAAKARSFVSGLLIGTEFADAHDSGSPCDTVSLICSPMLVSRYERAATLFGIGVATIDPHAAYCAALTHFLKQGAL
jgi:2-dehydro-3-deoxygalactonokinase